MRRLLLALALAAPLGATAQPVDVAALDALFEAPPTVEVNLRGSLLRLASEAARAEEPEAALMLDGLRAVTVRVYTLGATRDLAVRRLADVGQRFEADGWWTFVRVRSQPGDTENDGDVWIYVRDAGDAFDGMAVMAVDNEDDNAVFVLIDGTIDPAQVGALTRRFADVDVDDEADQADRDGDSSRDDDDQ
ncbi:DUF4252 domain-containing protein [Rubrivirga sp. S365]|uniref:DUF4252 domain-containing protein n=1 Tax=Rubrivirga sp. S365 TaxID=3076080 RepID=UPI0028C572D9|nr:DUF4252 domain-containing protein [Rubrivirga sp. S365]MDT7857090.1 DUF4252 domain-containing protein [Rubrivirga sp. S365]